MPDYQLPEPARLDDERLGVALFRIRRQSPPEFLAGDLIERHDFGIRPATDDCDHAFSVDQRGVRDSPSRHFGAKVFDVVLSPDHAACANVQTEKDTAGADDIHAVAVHCRSCARPDGVADAAVVRLPLARPKSFARLLIETK